MRGLLKLAAAAALSFTVSTLSFAGTSTEEAVKAKMKESDDKIKKDCGCRVKLSYDSKWDMTDGDLLYNAEYQFGSVADGAAKFCGESPAHKKKFCGKVKSFAIKAHKKETKTDMKGTAFTSYIDISNKAQYSNHGDAFIDEYLKK